MRSRSVALQADPLYSGDVHVVELAGRTRVVVKGRRVVEVGRPLIRSCPLWKRRVGVTEFTPDFVKKRVEEVWIGERGVFTEDRSLEPRGEVDFGASEIMMSAMLSGLLECSVQVCEGAGTVITDDSKLTQGIGGKQAGVVYTSPIPKLIERLEASGVKVLDPERARIDQVAGVRLARELGFKRIGVTITSFNEAAAIRRLEEELDVTVAIFAVHLTGARRDEVVKMGEYVDVMTTCASRWAREEVASRALIQAGVYIPVLGLTELGKKLILNRAEKLRRQVVVHHAALPLLMAEQPDPLI